jgi:phosphoribosylformylglycinamidine synthase
MYVDGHLPGRYGETHKVSALESLQFSATSVVDDVKRCVTLDPKMAGDLVYILGSTQNELGGSEYYDMMDYVGCNVPQVDMDANLPLYQALARAIEAGYVASAHGIYRGGLGIHLSMKAMAGGLGLNVDLAAVPTPKALSDDQLLYSESAGRFIVTVDPKKQGAFEDLFKGLSLAVIGRVTQEPSLLVRSTHGDSIIELTVPQLKKAWQKPFGDLV